MYLAMCVVTCYSHLNFEWPTQLLSANWVELSASFELAASN